MDNLEKIISRLPIRGATLVGGPEKAGFVPILNEDGELDPSLAPGAGAFSAAAADVTFSPVHPAEAIAIDATNVQAAIEEVNNKKLTMTRLLADIPEPSRAAAFSNIKQAASAGGAGVTGVVKLATNVETEAGASTTLVPPVSATEATYLKKSGGTISGTVLSITPTVDTQVAIKSYVDDSIESANAGVIFSHGNTVFVDIVNGVDATGARGRSDKPFLTLAAAKTAASAGDTIIVRPGAYTGNNLFKTGVNWYFMLGAQVTHGGATTAAIFDDNASGAVTTRIAGYGVFIGSGANRGIFNLTNVSSIVNVQCHSITTSGSPGLKVTDGTHTIQIGTATATDHYFVQITGGSTLAYIDKAVELYSSSASYGMSLSGGTNSVQINVGTTAKGGINISGGTNTLHGNVFTATGGDAFTVTAGTTTCYIREVNHVFTTTRLLAAATTSTIKFVGCQLSSTSASDAVVHITGTSPAVTLKNCEIISSTTTYAVKGTVAHTVNLRGFLTVSLPTLNITYVGGALELL